MDREVPRKTIIFSGMTMMIGGCLAIHPRIFKSSAVWAAIMLSIIDFGSGLTQVIGLKMKINRAKISIKQTVMPSKLSYLHRDRIIVALK